MDAKLRLYLPILAIAALFVFAPLAQSASPSPFVGAWQATDVDGSDIRLAIAGSPDGPFQITWTESYFRFCDGGPGIARGSGQLAEDDPLVLDADLRLECFTMGETLDFHVTWIYDPGTDTISSGYATWHRPSAQAKPCMPPPSGLTAWWPGDGDANDLIAGRNGAFHGDAATGSGLVNLAFHLDGDGDFIDVPHDPALDVGAGAFTIDLWVNFNDTAGEQVLVEKWIQGDGLVDGWTLTKLNGNVLRLAMEDGFGGELDLDSDPLDIRPGVWYHFAAVRLGGAVTLYMNGAPIVHNPEMGAVNLSSTSSLKFGHRGSFEDTPGSIDDRGFYLNGRIDEVELFVGAALSEDQILAIYQAGSAGKCKDEAFRTPRIDLRVNYGHDWVESFYGAGHTVRITVSEGDGATVKATAELITEPKDFWGGDPGFQTQWQDWVPDVPDIQPYDWVYAQLDGGETVQVRIGDIGGMIDLEADAIEGTIMAPWFTDAVPVECLDWGSGGGPFNKDAGIILPDGTETYSCRWDAETEWDIQPRQDVGVGYFGPDGHWVANAFRVPFPHFRVFPEWEYLDGSEWPDGATVTASVEGKPDCSASAVAGYPEWDRWNTFFAISFPQGCNVEVGDVVTVTDDVTIRVHTVQNLVVTAMDKEANIVSGTADDGALVTAWVHGFGEIEVQLLVEDGAWLADFGSIGFDLLEGMCGRAEIRDEVGSLWTSATAIDWCIPNPRFIAFPAVDQVLGFGWPEGSQVHLSINDPPDFTQTVTVGPGPWDENEKVAYFDFGGLYDMKPGDVVTLSGSGMDRTHVVRLLTIDEWNVEEDTVTGTADDSEVVHVYVFEFGDSVLQVSPDGGIWKADFKTLGIDLVAGTCGRSDIWDEQGNTTTVDWCIPYPSFAAYMPGIIEGYDWTMGHTISININDGEYVAQAVSEQRPGFPEGVTRVLFELWRDDFFMKAGDYIVVTDEAINFSKELWVADLQVTDIDVTAQTVSGIYDPDRSFWVRLEDQEPLDVQFDGNTWVATFTAMTPGAWGFVAQDDADYDGTVWDFQVPNE